MIFEEKVGIKSSWFEIFWKPGIKVYNKINELSNTTYNISHMCVVCELWCVTKKYNQPQTSPLIGFKLN
jgi:hypothetical protein